MANKKTVFFLILALGALAAVIFDFFGLLFFRASSLPLPELLLRGGLFVLVYLILYAVVQGQSAEFFDSPYLAALKAGTGDAVKKEDEEAYHHGLEKMGSIPIKTIAIHVLFQLALAGAMVFSGNFLGIDRNIGTLIFLYMLSLGMLAGTFVYVMTDSLVSRTLISRNFVRYPRSLREGRQSLKVFIIPIAVALISIVFTASTIMLELNRSGGNSLNMAEKGWIPIFSVQGFFFICVFILAFILKKNTGIPYDSVILQLENLSSEQKDLTRRVSICSVDELGTLAGMINSFCETMSLNIGEIKEEDEELAEAGGKLQDNAAAMASSLEQISGTAAQVRGKTEEQFRSVSASVAAVNQIIRNIESLESSINTQASSMGAASAAVEGMLGNIGSINIMTEKMVTQFKVLEEAAQEGGRIQKESGEKINDIVAQSQSLQRANKIIAAIAAQTNLLAMNAAIEAAHAGDAGQGFAVVADEIRKLAENSSRESHNISNELKQIVQTIDHIVKGAHATENAFSQVSVRIADTQNLVSQVEDAIRGQSEGTDQVMQSLKVMNDITAEVKLGAREMGQGSGALLREVDNLQGSAREISSRMEAVSEEIVKVSEGAQDVSGLARTNRTISEKIFVIVDGFKV
ncbi:MAG: methyl-accepting chemotaxis protein [Treponema sp.]|jgi:methyl-accepting chemotaxis protein|nr:methyl-accepting chemotaxis protein [Treponema sp.]